MKLIILDRDGVINHDSDKYVKTADEWNVIPESLEAIANLTQSGYKIVVCTNQSGIGRGLFTTDELHDIHEKPKPGMIFDICERFNVENIADVMMVGDSERDLEAISLAGGIPVLVKTGNGKKTLSKGKIPPGTMIFDNLFEVSHYLINRENDEHEKN